MPVVVVVVQRSKVRVPVQAAPVVVVQEEVLTEQMVRYIPVAAAVVDRITPAILAAMAGMV